MTDSGSRTIRPRLGLGFKIKAVVVSLVILMVTVAALSFYILQQFRDQVVDYSDQTLPALAASIDLNSSLEKIVQNTEQLVNSDVQARRRIAHTATQDSVAGITNLLASRDTLLDVEEIRTVLAILSETTNDLNTLIEDKIDFSNRLDALHTELGDWVVTELTRDQQNTLSDRSAAFNSWVVLERRLIQQVANLSTSSDVRSQQRQIPGIMQALRRLAAAASTLPTNERQLSDARLATLEAKFNGTGGVVETLRNLNRTDARSRALERQMRVLVAELLRKTDSLATQKSNEAQSTAQNLVEQSQQQLIALVISVTVALIIAVIGFFFIEKRVLARLVSLRDAVIGRAAGGDHSVSIDGHDEVTEIGNAVQTFIDEIDNRQKQILQSAEQTNAIIRLSPQAMCIVAGNQILYHNDAFELLWPGCGSPEENKSILSMFPSILIDEAGPAGVRSVARHAINDTNNDTGASVRWFNMTSNMVEWHGQKARQVIVVDTTKQVQVEHTLEDARRRAEAAAQAKSNFLAMMSHEIRSPMNGIISVGEMLEKSDLDSEQNQLVTIINQSAETLLTILDDVLDLSKIEAGKLQINAHQFNLRSVLTGVANLLEQGFKQKNVSLTVDLADDLPQTVSGDSNRIRQIMYNLLSNALKFTESGSVQLAAKVKASAPDQPCTVQIAVTDTGIGINSKVLNRLFQPFEQADSSIARQYGGTGLGLSICRRLADLMGGTITVDSTEGRGSTFALTVPLETVPDDIEVSERPASEPTPDRTNANAHILVVEDNKINQIVIGKILKSLGYSWDTAEDGVNALEVFDPARHTIILTDLRMPRMDGYTLASEIRSLEGNGSTVPIIALSADAMEEAKEKSEQSGIDVFLTKPVKMDEVRECLNSFG